MKELWRQMRIDLLTSSILCILFGALMIWKPLETVDFFCQIFAVILIVLGILFAGSYLLSFVTNGTSLFMGIVVALVGVLLLIKPGIMEVIFPITIGVILFYHGFEDVRMALQSKKYGYDRWTWDLGLSLVTLFLGVFCIIDAFVLVKGAMIILGIALIYNGISNILVTRAATKSARAYEKKMEPLEGKFKDSDQ